MTLDRKDYKSAIPQLEKRIAQVEKIGKDVQNKFDDIAHQTQLDAAEAEKKAAALDFQMDTLNVVMEYQLVQNGQSPVEANWSTTMPTLDKDTSDYTVWYRSVTYRNEIAVRKTDPQTVNIMDGVYAFVNTVSGEDVYGHPNWTTIDGSTIKTGRILSHSGYCYFDLDDNALQMKDASTLQQSNSVLAWDNGQLYIKGKIAIGNSTSDRTYYTEMTGGGFDIVASGVNLAHIGYSETRDASSGEKKPYYTLGKRKYNPTEYGKYELGSYSLAQGYDVRAISYCSHAEGIETFVDANAWGGHAEGYGTTAGGQYSHAEGVKTRAGGTGSHTSGYYTYVQDQYQTAIGVANDYFPAGLFFVGNGTVVDDEVVSRSNALSVYENGLVEAAGEIRGVLANPTISVAVSAGTLQSATVYRQGNVVQLLISFRNSSATASGGDVFSASINTTDLRPKVITTSGSYYASYALNATISTGGTITIRNADSRQLPAMTANGNISFTYLVD